MGLSRWPAPNAFGAARLGCGVANHGPERLFFDIAPAMAGECIPSSGTLWCRDSGFRAKSPEMRTGVVCPGPVIRTDPLGTRSLSQDNVTDSQLIAAYLPKNGWGVWRAWESPSRQIAPPRIAKRSSFVGHPTRGGLGKPNRTFEIDSPDIHSSACFRFSPPFPLVATQMARRKWLVFNCLRRCFQSFPLVSAEN
jgi:hypothetical protein